MKHECDKWKVQERKKENEKGREGKDKIKNKVMIIWKTFLKSSSCFYNIFQYLCLRTKPERKYIKKGGY